ncbi:hypothetical protein ACLIMP_18815 [Novosphingobium aerophilum]|uniref:hypothetical protein n=1 Tax=Novosphingobium TaxID=165696 RepID=UPI002D77BC40|nr:hypothetical protein [Novosphingobium sp. RL4]WRT95318.1 hypothetical protein U9J33_24390 [Novosphingobium sp. RL4]
MTPAHASFIHAGRPLLALGAALAGAVLVVQANLDRLRPASAAATETSLADRLAERPYDAAALRELALLRQRTGKGPEALVLARLGGELGWRDSRTQTMLIADEVRRGDETQAIRRIDALLRRKPALEPLLLPVLHRAATDARGRDALLDRLAAAPSWQDGFFRQLGTLPPELETAHEQLLAQWLQGPAPHRRDDLIAYVKVLVDRREYRRARTLWIAHAGTGDTPVLDPAFAQLDPAAPSGSAAPFAWSAQRVPGAELEMVAGSGGKAPRRLSVTAGQSAFGTLLSQHIVLAPGRYSIDALMPSSAAFRRGALHWTVDCLPRGPSIAMVGTAAAGRWRQSFAVPQSGCTAQVLSLAARRTDDPAPSHASIERVLITPSPDGPEDRS